MNIYNIIIKGKVKCASIKELKEISDKRLILKDNKDKMNYILSCDSHGITTPYYQYMLQKDNMYSSKPSDDGGIYLDNNFTRNFYMSDNKKEYNDIHNVRNSLYLIRLCNNINDFESEDYDPYDYAEGFVNYCNTKKYIDMVYKLLTSTSLLDNAKQGNYELYYNLPYLNINKEEYLKKIKDVWVRLHLGDDNCITKDYINNNPALFHYICSYAYTHKLGNTLKLCLNNVNDNKTLYFYKSMDIDYLSFIKDKMVNSNELFDLVEIVFMIERKSITKEYIENKYSKLSIKYKEMLNMHLYANDCDPELFYILYPYIAPDNKIDNTKYLENNEYYIILLISFNDEDYNLEYNGKNRLISAVEEESGIANEEFDIDIKFKYESMKIYTNNSDFTYYITYKNSLFENKDELLKGNFFYKNIIE